MDVISKAYCLEQKYTHTYLEKSHLMSRKDVDASMKEWPQKISEFVARIIRFVEWYHSTAGRHVQLDFLVINYDPYTL